MGSKDFPHINMFQSWIKGGDSFHFANMFGSEGDYEVHSNPPSPTSILPLPSLLHSALIVSRVYRNKLYTGISMFTKMGVTLFNGVKGVELQMFNGVCVSHLFGPGQCLFVRAVFTIPVCSLTTRREERRTKRHCLLGCRYRDTNKSIQRIRVWNTTIISPPVHLCNLSSRDFRNQWSIDWPTAKHIIGYPLSWTRTQATQTEASRKWESTRPNVLRVASLRSWWARE